MKFLCECGATIRDQTDFLPNKAYVIGDKDWFKFWDAIEEASRNPDEPNVFGDLTINDPSRFAFECEACGRLYLHSKDHELVEYVPSNKTYNRILDR